MAGKKRKSSEKQPKEAAASRSAPTPTRWPTPGSAAKRHQAEEEASVPSSISAKILREVLKQKQEEGLAEAREQRPSSAAAPSAAAAAPSTSSFFPADDGDNDDEEDVDEFDGFDVQSEYDGGVPEIDEDVVANRP